MPKPQIFVSCGQRTTEEKLLAGEICKIIQEHGRFDYFFAEFQHSLHGLNENILDALARTAGFVTVIHGRGGVVFGSGEVALTRASVWIEQEIAIAAYIARTANPTLLTAAYIEKGVGREGIRDLLHLNPLEFDDNQVILEDLKARLQSWSPLVDQRTPWEDGRGKLELKFSKHNEAGLSILNITPILTNKGARAKEYSCTMEVPAPLMSWTNAFFMIGKPTTRPGYRSFRVTDETKQGEQIFKGDSMDMMILPVSMAHLSPDERDVVFKQSIYVSAELEEHSYTIDVLCDVLF